MSPENNPTISQMNEDFNRIEERGKRYYEGRFLTQVFQNEFTETHRIITPDGICQDRLVFLETALKNRKKLFGGECYVGLRQRSMDQPSSFWQYLRIADSCRFHMDGKRSIRILTLPFERVTPFLSNDENRSTHIGLFEHMQCELISKGVCLIVLFSTDGHNNKVRIEYKVNMSEGSIKRLKEGKDTIGTSAIRVWKKLSAQRFERKDYKAVPDPFIWDQQFFSPQEPRR